MAIPRNLANIAPHVNASSTELVINDGGANLDFRVEGDTNANLLFADAGAEKVGFGTNTFNTNGGVIQVSNGISFPASQSALIDPNTLDDYEEGTWTPTLVASGATISNINTSGRYIKVGRSVTLYGYIQQYVSAGGGANAVTITGVPFTSQSGITIAGGQGIIGSFIDNANGFSISFKLTSSSTTIEYLKYIDDSGTSKVDSVKSTDITNANHSSQFSFSYLAGT